MLLSVAVVGSLVSVCAHSATIRVQENSYAASVSATDYAADPRCAGTPSATAARSGEILYGQALALNASLGCAAARVESSRDANSWSISPSASADPTVRSAAAIANVEITFGFEVLGEGALVELTRWASPTLNPLLADLTANQPVSLGNGPVALVSGHRYLFNAAAAAVQPCQSQRCPPAGSGLTLTFTNATFVVPEPASGALLGVALLGALGAVRRPRAIAFGMTRGPTPTPC